MVNVSHYWCSSVHTTILDKFEFRALRLSSLLLSFTLRYFLTMKLLYLFLCFSKLQWTILSRISLSMRKARVTHSFTQPHHVSEFHYVFAILILTNILLVNFGTLSSFVFFTLLHSFQTPYIGSSLTLIYSLAIPFNISNFVEFHVCLCVFPTRVDMKINYLS